MTKQKFIYSVADVAAMIENPLLNTKPKMFRFLRKYGILNEMIPQAELIAQGYFTIEYRMIRMGSYGSKTCEVVRISKQGVDFIKKLAKLIYG